MNGNKTVTANFFSRLPRTLTVTVNPAGTGTVIKNPDQVTYVFGSQVKLEANSADGWVFSHWSGDAFGSFRSVSITMNSDKAVVANFIESGTTAISTIKQSPSTYEGQVVKLAGEYRGWQVGYGSPPVTRSDWVLEDVTGFIYVTGSTLDLKYPDDLGKYTRLVGTVRLKNGQPYVEVPKK
jgi:hypothetical protein